MSKIRSAFEGGNKKAFIPFITCGDPSLEVTEQLVYAMEEAGTNLIELGIPFSDPTAESPVIQAANIRALSGGVTTDKIFAMVEKIRKNTQIPMVFMTYVKEYVKSMCGASSDTELFKNNRSTIRFQGHRIATCLYRTPMGGCIEKTVAFYIPHNLKIIKYAQRSLLPSPGANGRCFFCLQRKEASVKWQFFV